MDCSTCMCPCCSKSAANKTKTVPAPLSEADFRAEKRALRREMGHIKVKDLAQDELIEELQKRVKQLQDRVCDLLDFVTYNTYDRQHLVSPSVTEPLKQEPKMHRWFTPMDIYCRYLVGDYDKEGKDVNPQGFQLDDDIRNRVTPKPNEIITPINYLPSPDEDDRPEDRIKVKEMFIAIGQETGASESDLSEIYEMLEDPTYRTLAIDMLKKLWIQGVMDKMDSSSDTEELDSP